MKPVVRTVFHGLDKMTRGERRKIYNWLVGRARWVLKHGDLAAPLYKQTLYK